MRNFNESVLRILYFSEMSFDLVYILTPIKGWIVFPPNLQNSTFCFIDSIFKNRSHPGV